jgi:dynein heavy chain 2
MKLVVSFEQEKIRSQHVVRIKGLLLQGCGFDGVRLIDPPANLSEFISLPVINVSWMGERDPDPYPHNQMGVFIFSI